MAVSKRGHYQADNGPKMAGILDFEEAKTKPSRFKNPNQVGSPQGPDRAASGSYQGPMTRMGPSISVLEVVLSVYLGGKGETGAP